MDSGDIPLRFLKARIEILYVMHRCGDDQVQIVKNCANTFMLIFLGTCYTRNHFDMFSFVSQS